MPARKLPWSNKNWKILTKKICWMFENFGMVCSDCNSLMGIGKVNPETKVQLCFFFYKKKYIKKKYLRCCDAMPFKGAAFGGAWDTRHAYGMKNDCKQKEVKSDKHRLRHFSKSKKVFKVGITLGGDFTTQVWRTDGQTARTRSKSPWTSNIYDIRRI